MTLSDVIQSEIKKSSHRTGVCTAARVSSVIEDLKDKEVYLRVLENSNRRDPEFLSTEKLAYVMSKEGYEGASPSSINRHRRKICSCYRSAGVS